MVTPRYPIARSLTAPPAPQDPAVLGLVAWYEIDRGFGLATIRAGLQSLADDGMLEAAHTDALGLLLYGALTEASLALGAGLTTVDEADIIETVERILHAFVPAGRR